MSSKIHMILAIVLLMIVGCSTSSTSHSTQPQSQTTATAAAPTPSEPESISALREEAKRRHLHFKIWCNDNDDEGFTGFAWPDTLDGDSIYIEEGGVPGWIVSGSTQEGAAIKLTQAIKRPTNWYPEHKKAKKHKDLCPPEIKG